MRSYYWIVTVVVICLGAISLSFEKRERQPNLKKLRKLYSSGEYSKWPAPVLHNDTRAGFRDIGSLDDVTHPTDNPYNAAKRDLGRILFFDPRLSASGQIACASCHDPQLGWGDGKRVAFGHDRKLGTRNAMTLFNVAFYDRFFWDGRALSLEDQAHFPIQDHLEMNESLDVMEQRVQRFRGYRPMFQKAFGDTSINRERIFKAIACFERTIISPSSRFDLFIKGKADALTDQELQGLHLYRTKAGCINCHNTPLFSDNRFHNDGQTLWGSDNEDLGLYNVTKHKEDVGKFKTPSLREVANTGPWFHHGNFPTLKDVVLFYSLGNPAPIQKKYLGTPRDSLLPVTSPILRKLNLSDAEVNAVVAFMQAITTTPRRMNPPVDFPK